MVHEPEFEGDTFYSKDGASIDPDIALSYIGDKVQSILGHFQKDFEGDCSAENLGARYGGYGSFLPMYHRSQSHVAAQRKSPQRVQIVDMHRSLNHILPEARVPGAGTPNKHFVPTPTVRPENLRTLIDNDLMRERLSSDKIAVASPQKVELPSIKSDNGPENRTLKVRIKVGPNIIAKYNSEIYNLGLASPSSSEGYRSEELQCESPSKILQMMASAPIAVSLLVSPLSEDLFNLTKEKHFSKKDKHEASPLSSDKSSMIFKTNNSKVKSRSLVKSKNVEESENEHKVDRNDLLETNHESEIASCNARYYKTSSDTIRLPDVNNKVKRMKRSVNDAKGIAGSGDSVMRASLEHSSQHCYDKYEQQPKSRRSSANTAYLDTSKWKKFKKAVDNTNVGIKGLPHKHDDLGLPRADSLPTDDCKTLKDAHISELLALKSADGSKGNSSAVPKNKNCRKIDFPPIENNVVLSCSEQKRSLDKPKKINLKVGKQKASSAGKTTETSSSRKDLESVTYDEPTLRTSALAVLSNDGTNAGSDQTLAAPVLINEDWVACDRCETWRLLPYGTKLEQLPKRWVCSMLDWLPGMIHCDISEDETTKAVQALYQVPICGDQCNNLAHDGRTVTGVLTACAPRLDPNDQNHAIGRNSGQLKKLKLKEKLISDEPVSINSSKKAVQQNALKRGNLEKVNRSIATVNARNDFDSPCPNRLASDGGELKKRKGNHLTKDDETQRKRMKKLSAQHADGKEENIKTKSAPAAKNFQISAGASGNYGQISEPSLPNRAALNYSKKSGVPTAKLSGGTGNFKIHIQIQKNQMRDLPNNKSLDVEMGNEGKTTIKKIKLKDYGCSKPQGETTWQNNGSILQDKASNAGSDFIRDKKSLASWIGQEELTQGQSDGKSKGKGYPSNMAENGEHIKKHRAQMRITMEDIYKLKKDMDGEQVPMAAISSSSIVTDSRKKRSYTEMKGSPAESVSSSVARLLSYPNQISPMISETVVGVNHEFNGLPTVGIANESGNIIPDFRKTDARNKFSDELSSHTMVGINKDHPQTICRKNSSLLSMDINTTDPFTGVKVVYPKNKSKDETDTDGTDPRRVKMDVELHQGDKQGAQYPGKRSLGSSRSSKKNYLETKPLDTSVANISSKVLKGETFTSLLNHSDNHLNADAEKRVVFESTPVTKQVTGGYLYGALTEAQGVLKEAEELKSHADLIKSSGFLSESNYEYLKVSLMYLKGASLLEACDAGSGRCFEGDPVEIYGNAAKLFKICAHEYEKYHEMAAAAVAYKCMEVAYLRVVSCKNLNTSRFWHDMQSSLQMVPQGESPSSSASDVDNLSNLATATLSKSSGSRPINHVVAPHSRPNFVQLLDFIQDVNSAMEAAKKSQDTFAASQLNLKESRYKDTIVCIKRVIDFSFQDVQELTRLVELALNAINHDGLRSQRE